MVYIVKSSVDIFNTFSMASILICLWFEKWLSMIRDGLASLAVGFLLGSKFLTLTLLGDDDQELIAVVIAILPAK